MVDLVGGTALIKCSSTVGMEIWWIRTTRQTPRQPLSDSLPGRAWMGNHPANAPVHTPRGKPKIHSQWMSPSIRLGKEGGRTRD